jgi:hypothetical protein
MRLVGETWIIDWRALAEEITCVIQDGDTITADRFFARDSVFGRPRGNLSAQAKLVLPSYVTGATK